MSTLGEKTVLAVDPGSSKCGIALVHRNNERQLKLVWRCVVPTPEVAEMAVKANGIQPFSLVIVGSGTRSRDIVHRLRDAMPSVGILVVDEKDTSLQARERYWEHNPRRGWRKLLPATLQTPPDPIDDFAAMILAERVLLD